MGDLKDATTIEQIRDCYIKYFPGEKPTKLNNAVAMIFKFRSILKEGLTYNPQNREYLVGEIKGDYRFDTSHKYQHVRDVAWLGIVRRDDLSPGSRAALGGFLALFSVNDETGEDIFGVLHGKKKMGEEAEDEREELEQIKEDTISRAHELIKDRILRLDDEEMEELVAAILRAMGYKARATPKGPDRGVDVIASPDGLGLEEPRIKAEVKHRPKTTMGSQEIRSFLGGLRPGDRALYVSTGGFSKDAAYEAERANVPITLVGLDDLASLVVAHYQNFDMDGRVLVPLVRLYWPVE
jgi:restriction system protein